MIAMVCPFSSAVSATVVEEEDDVCVGREDELACERVVTIVAETTVLEKWTG